MLYNRVHCTGQVTLLPTAVYALDALVRLTRLKRRRLEKGWTLRDLSEASGLSRQTLSFLERGQREPRPGNITLLARVLECDPVDLMEPDE